MIKVTRGDPLGCLPEEGYSTTPGILSVEKFETWPEVFEYLRGRNIPLSAENEQEISANKDTQFSWREFVDFGGSAGLINVAYDIRLVD